jgi:hypothetical protein
VLEPQNKIIPEETKATVRKLLLEKISLTRICRVTDVSQKWLLDFIRQEYAQTPRDLNVQVSWLEINQFKKKTSVLIAA